MPRTKTNFKAAKELKEFYESNDTVYADLSKIIKDQKAEIKRLKNENEILSKSADNAFQGVVREALDIINHQQEEIEQWKEEANKYQRLWCIAIDDVDDIETAQSEAIKEFAERLQIRCIKQDGCLWSSDIGAELKEMVGEE